MSGFQYYVIFVDDYSRYVWIYFLRRRFELQQIYYNFASMVHTQFSCKIKIFFFDNAMEYRESNFKAFLAQNGSMLQHSCPGTS